MALFRKQRPPTIVPVAGLCHPGATAFGRELWSGDHEAALERYAALPSTALKEFYVTQATGDDAFGGITDRLPQWSEDLVAAHSDVSLSWTLRGSLGINVAWAIRGGGRAHTVRPDAWDQCHAHQRRRRSQWLRRWTSSA